MQSVADLYRVLRSVYLVCVGSQTVCIGAVEEPIQSESEMQVIPDSVYRIRI